MGTNTNARLEGPFRLLVDDVRFAATGRKYGVYALGSLSAGGGFAVSYLGASYEDLQRELCERIGTAPYFKFREHTDPEKAFLQLCELFHAFHPSGNFLHPERPKGSRISCPICDPQHLRPASGARHR